MFEKPSTTGYTIYSKSQCPACEKTRDILTDAKYINCDEYLDDTDTFIDFMWSLTSSFPKAFPMIFKDGQYIGSYKDILNEFTTDAEF